MEELSRIPPRDKTRGSNGIAPGFHVEVKPHARHIPPSFRKEMHSLLPNKSYRPEYNKILLSGSPSSVKVI
jgi:hypothetical protein